MQVDVETGKVTFLAYTGVHDCDTLVNPMTLAGHVRGGVVQRIGTEFTSAITTTVTVSCWNTRGQFL
jgi:CO/xanthine dehydrogenase Mo-binding subunit